MAERDHARMDEVENRAFQACLEVGKILTSTVDLHDVLERIMEKVSELIDAQHWSLLLKDPDTGELTFEILVGVGIERVRGLRMKPGEGIAGHVARTGEALWVPSVRDDPQFCPKVDEQTGFTTDSILCVPLRIHGETLGVIEVVNVKDMAAFESTHLPVLTTLADYAAIAIRNSQLVARIERMSITDEYTGLYNARYLHQVLDERLAEARQKGARVAVVFVDVDDFKHVVDTYGHLQGTQVLREVGQTIASRLSGRDMLLKYGGDEFVMLLPGRDRSQALEVVSDVVEAVRSSTYLTGEQEPVRVTASFGIAMFPEDASTKKDLLLKADKAMYAVKNSTKDGVGTC